MQIDTTEKENNFSLGSRPGQTKMATQKLAELSFDPDRLKIYYNQVFPYQLMFRWISYNKLN